MKIKLNTITDVNSFVSVCSKFYDGHIDVKQERQIVDGRSILGIYSLNLIKPLDVIFDTENKDDEYSFYNTIEQWSVDERY